MICRALPLLVFHRQNWSLLRPIVVANDNNALADLQVCRWVVDMLLICVSFRLLHILLLVQPMQTYARNASMLT
jgi:hypothetical protein